MEPSLCPNDGAFSSELSSNGRALRSAPFLAPQIKKGPCTMSIFDYAGGDKWVVDPTPYMEKRARTFLRRPTNDTLDWLIDIFAAERIS